MYIDIKNTGLIGISKNLHEISFFVESITFILSRTPTIVILKWARSKCNIECWTWWKFKLVR